jgi:hypothetical protein
MIPRELGLKLRSVMLVAAKTFERYGHITSCGDTIAQAGVLPYTITLLCGTKVNPCVLFFHLCRWSPL